MSDIVTLPTKSGPFGRAWSIDFDAVHRALKLPAGTNLASWILEARWAHPVWHSYFITLVHLRPQAGLPDAVLYRPDATHEFMLFALDPKQPREPQLREQRAAILMPPNFGAQLVEVSDADAIARVDQAIDMVLAGLLNPDTDARQSWVALFGDTMIKPEFRAQ
jgi:hypothetical protein